MNGPNRGQYWNYKNVHFSYQGGAEVLKERTSPWKAARPMRLLVLPAEARRRLHHSWRVFTIQPAAKSSYGGDMRSYAPEERTKKIGFILQDPFLFTGSIRDNICT